MGFNSGFKGLIMFIIHLYFRTVHVVIFILFKPTHALFLKHIHIHIQNTKFLKMFVKHIIKTLHVLVTNVWPSSGGRLSCLVLSLLLCLFASSNCLFGMWLYVLYVCACLVANKQFDDANNQRSSKSTKHKRRPPEEGQTIVTETCRVVMMCFTNIFNNLVF